MQQAKHTVSRQHPRSAVTANFTRAKPAAGFTDNRPAAIAQRALAESIESGPRAVAQRALMSAIHDGPYGAVQRRRLAGMFGETAQLAGGQEEELLQGKFSPLQRQGVEEEEMLQGKFAPVQRVGGPGEEDLLQGKFSPVQRQGPEEEEMLQGKFAPVQRVGEQEEELLQGKFAPVQRAEAGADREPRENNTGLPDNLKAGIESLSGMSLDHVKVHYNSAQPAQLNALAYAQGSDIHVAPGQEQHLPHEAWHVVQQAQGRVKPTMQMKDGVPVNDDAGLEHEADVMGGNADRMTGIEVEQYAEPDPVMAGTKKRYSHPVRTAAQSRMAQVAQRQLIGTVNVYVDDANYPVWEQAGMEWHLTMKDSGRWHVTAQDRSASYWFEIDGGVVTSTKPTKTEYGGQKKKHHSLDEAPPEVRLFIKTHISTIIKVTDKKPKY